MRDENTIVRERQQLIRREMDRRGISIKAVQYDGGWETSSTVLSYFPNPEGGKEPQTMSVAAFYRLISRKALPLELLSTMLPDGFLIVRAPENINHDEIAEAMHDFLQTKERAHHPESEEGRELGPNEREALRDKFTVIQGKAA